MSGDECGSSDGCWVTGVSAALGPAALPARARRPRGYEVWGSGFFPGRYRVLRVSPWRVKSLEFRETQVPESSEQSRSALAWCWR